MADQRGREYVRRLERMRQSREARFETRLSRFFDAAASAATTSFRSGGNVVATVTAHNARLSDILLPLYLQTSGGVQGALAAFYGYRALPNRDPFINLAGSRIGGINNESKRLVVEAVSYTHLTLPTIYSV